VQAAITLRTVELEAAINKQLQENELDLDPNPITILIELVFGTIMNDNSQDLFDYPELDTDPVDALLDELIMSTTCRYMDRPIQYRRRTVDIIQKISNFSDAECKSVLRMSWSSFQKLTALLFEHEVFQSSGPREQEEVAAQLAVTLDRLGHNGTGMSPIRFGLFWGRSPNACRDFYTRGIQAILSLTHQFVAWPSPTKRAAHSDSMAAKGFSGCVGFVDGTTIPFSERPEVMGDFYFDRKNDHSLNAQVINDKDKRITYIFSGYSGTFDFF
jgi:hypothetical protein